MKGQSLPIAKIRAAFAGITINNKPVTADVRAFTINTFFNVSITINFLSKLMALIILKLIFCDKLKAIVKKMEILGLHLQPFIDYARLRGKKVSWPDSLETTVHKELFHSILTEINDQLADEQLGIHVGNFLNLNALGLIYQISLQATSIEEGIYYLKNFVAATLPIVNIENRQSQEKQVIRLALNQDWGTLSHIILTCLQVVIAKELRMMSSVDVDIRLPTPYYNNSYPLSFEYGNTHDIEFSNILLKSTVKSYRNHHLDYLVPQYLQMIEGLKKDDNFVNNVKIATLNMATPALPKLEKIANSFNMSPRTFQRTLAKEQLTFRQLTDNLNKEIALMLLRHDYYTITDIGYLLGYSEPAAFLHSFKKWYGNTPRNFRQQLQNK